MKNLIIYTLRQLLLWMIKSGYVPKRCLHIIIRNINIVHIDYTFFDVCMCGTCNTVTGHQKFANKLNSGTLITRLARPRRISENINTDRKETG